MDHRRKRRVRFVAALAAAVTLAAVLAYTSFAGSREAATPRALLAAAETGRSYELTGRVMPGYERRGDTLRFRVRERGGGASVPVTYTGTVPDPFRAAREVIVTVRREGGGAGGFVGERDSLITKCPSKFSAEKAS
jgi:cytochrome c-type biogenesis protein CcmE